MSDRSYKQLESPSTSRNNEISTSNAILTIHKMAEDIENSYGSCQAALTRELGMRCVSVKFIPCNYLRKYTKCTKQPK
jgi:hypothetical protein